jgi:predicted ester cyclase
VVSVEDNKRLVARAVAEVINGGDLDVVDELYAPEMAEAAREWVAPFRAAFPDVRMDTVALIGEGDTVVGHYRCSGTWTGEWMGRPPTGRAFRDVREVYWFTVRAGRIVAW